MGISAILPAISMGAKLFAGAGGGGGGAMPAAPGPFDAIMSGAPMGGGQQPPAPQMNPLFASDRELFGGASPIPNKGVFADAAPPIPAKGKRAAVPPMPTRGPDVAELPGYQDPLAVKGAMPMPERAPPVSEMPGFQDPMQGLFATSPTSGPLAKTAPINSPDKRNNSERYSDAGWTLDSSTGQTIAPKPGKKGKIEPVADAETDAAPAKTKPSLASPAKLDKSVLDSGKSASSSEMEMDADEPVDADTEEDADNGYESGMSLFGPTVGGALGDLQDTLGDSATNPLFQVGMGLLAGGHDGTNPWLAMQKGLQAVPGHQISGQQADLAVKADARAERDQNRQDKLAGQDEQQRMQLMQLAKLLAAMGVQEPGSNVARGSAKAIR